MRSEGNSQESTSSGDNDAAKISIRWHPAVLQKTEIKADTSPNRIQALTLNKNLISMLTKFKAPMRPLPLCRSRKQSGHAAVHPADKKF